MQRAAPVTGCGQAWIPEAASCLTSKAPVNGNKDRWLVDTGCGYALLCRGHISSMKLLDTEGSEDMICPDGERCHHHRTSGSYDSERVW